MDDLSKLTPEELWKEYMRTMEEYAFHDCTNEGSTKTSLMIVEKEVRRRLWLYPAYRAMRAKAEEVKYHRVMSEAWNDGYNAAGRDILKSAEEATK